ncbi:glutamine amidotransferase-related protein [Mangrovicoccus ximenensis]|uniref:glutamine amidotransferase-related protein n=1 Tax=Mangrovicoccus ximenensis TaxID=1911570 RepID=UPI000D3BF63B|nr:gamma-glutamyl-gamma-aminobutyrate hydrolase family protein [Mangrovicoccus ximenensis]
MTSNKQPVTVTILEVGLVPETLRDRFGSLPGMFQAMIRRQDPSVIFKVVRVIEGESLPEPDDIESLLITGSSHGAYEEISWKADLEDLIRAVYARHIPMVGVCFGHQIIARAFGGEVRKADQGWGLGRHVYDVRPGNGLFQQKCLAISCSHQDQVLEKPENASTLLSSDFAPYAGLLYDNGTTLTFQPHPEFEPEYAHALCELREGIAPEDVIRKAKSSLNLPLDGDIVGQAITRVLKNKVAMAS